MANKLGEGGDLGKVRFARIQEEYDAVSTKGAVPLNNYSGEQIGTGVFDPLLDNEESEHRDIAFLDEIENAVSSTNFGHKRDSYFELSDYGLQCKVTAEGRTGNSFSSTTPEIYAFFLRSTSGEVKLHANQGLQSWAEYGTTLQNFLSIVFTLKTSGATAFSVNNDPTQRFQVYNVNTTGDRTITWGGFMGIGQGESAETNSLTHYLEGQSTNPSPGHQVILTIPAGENGEPGEWVKVAVINAPVYSKFVEENPGYSTYPRNVGLIGDNVSADIDHIQIQGLEKITHKKSTTSSAVERFKGTSKKQGKVRKVFDSINDTNVTYLEDYHTGLNYSGDADYTTAVYVLRVESDEPANFATWCSNFISTYGYPKILKSGYTDPADIAAYSVELDNYSIEYISNVDAAADPQCNGAVMIFYATLPATAVNNSAKDNIFSFGDTGVTIPGLSIDSTLSNANYQNSNTPLMGGYSSALYFIVGASPDTSDHLITTRKYSNWDEDESWDKSDALARSEVVSLSRDDQYKGFRYCTIGGLASRPETYIQYLGIDLQVPLHLPLLGAQTGLNYGNGSDLFVGALDYHYQMKGLMSHALPEPEDVSFSSIGDSFNPTYLWGGAYYLGHDIENNTSSGVAWSAYQNYHVPKSLRSPWNHGNFVEQIAPNYSNLFDELGNTDDAYMLYPKSTDSRDYASNVTRSHVNFTNYGSVHTTGSLDDRQVVSSYSDCSVFPENTFQVCLRGSLGTSKFSWDPRFGDLEDIHGGSVSTTGDFPGYYKYPFETAVLSFDRTYEDDHYWRGGTWDRYLSCHPVQGIGCDAYAVAGSDYPSRYNMLNAFVVNMISFRWDDSYYAPNIPIYFKYGRGDLDVSSSASVHRECFAATPPIYEEYLQLRNHRYHVAATGNITNGSGHDDWRKLQQQGYIDVWDTSVYNNRHGLMTDHDTYDNALPGNLSSSYNSRKMPYMGANPALLMQRNVPVAACNELSLDATSNPHYDTATPTREEPIGKVLDSYQYNTSDNFIEIGFAWRIVCVGTDPLDDDCPIYEVYITDASNIKQFNINNKQFGDDLGHDEPTGGYNNDYFKSEVNLYGQGEIPLDWKGNSQPLSNGGKRIEKLVLRFKPLKSIRGHSSGVNISGAGTNNNIITPEDISGDMWQDFAVAVNIENRYPTANLRYMLTPLSGGTLEKVSLLPSTGSMIKYNWGDDQDTGGNGQLVAPTRCGVKLYISDYPDLDKSYPVSKEHYRHASVRHTDGSYKTGKEALTLTRADQHADEKSVSTENNSANSNINSDASRFHNDDSYLHGFESLNHQPRLTSDLTIDNNGGPSGVYANNTSLTMAVHGHRATGGGSSVTSGAVSLSPFTTSGGDARKKHYRLGNKIGASVGGKFTYRVDPDSLSEEDWGFGGDRYMEMIDSLTIDGSCWPYQESDQYSFGNNEIEYRIGEVTLKNRIRGLIRTPKTFTLYYNDSGASQSDNGNGKFNHMTYVQSIDSLRNPVSGYNPWNNSDRLGGHDRGTYNSSTTVQGDTDSYYRDNTDINAYADRATITVDRGDTLTFSLIDSTHSESVERQDGHWVKRELNNSHQSDVEGVTNNGWEDIQDAGDPDDKIAVQTITWDTTKSKEGIYYLVSGEPLDDAGDPPKYFKIHLK